MSTDTTGTTPVIQLTRDTAKFKRIGGNRGVISAHAQKLAEAIKTDTDCLRYNPIIVNEKFEVIDGQHRLEAVKLLKMPVYYIQVGGLRLQNAQNLNRLSKPWTPTDYAKSYAELGKSDYQLYLEFKETYGLNHDVLLKYLSLDDMSTMELFRSGKFKVTNERKSHDLCKKLLDFEPFFPRSYKSRSFAIAFRMAWANKRYNHQEMLRKLASPKNELILRPIPEDYLRDIERIYNKNLPVSERVRFF